MAKKSRKRVRVSDLENGTRKVLHCACCGGDYSADRSDYFTLPDDHVMKCCDRPLVLAFRRTTYTAA